MRVIVVLKNTVNYAMLRCLIETEKLMNGCRLKSQRFCLTGKFSVPEEILSVICEKASAIMVCCVIGGEARAAV